MDREAPAIRAREHEQILRQPAEPLRLLRDAPERRLQLVSAPRLLQRQIHLGLEDAERCPELVTGLVHESPLAVEGLVQPVEHAVQRLGEALELVAGLGHRQPSIGLGRGDRRGFGPELLDGAERRACEDPPDDGEREEQDGTSDRDQRRQPQRPPRADPRRPRPP